MWLLPALPVLARWIAGVMHRITAIDGSVPATGPVLLVANHPNGLIDPLVVTAAAGRPVRWLAKSTLVYQPLIGWLFRAAGAIPVYRRQDDATQMDRNADTFSDAIEALRRGNVVALFPEGISHAAPSLAPLKTGAARLALQARQALGTPLPIIPVGAIYGDASIFRSPAGVVVGAPIAWEDLAAKGPDDREAVDILTDRIAQGLGAVTRQLDSWADQPIVEHAVAVVAASQGASAPPSWVARASGIHNLMDELEDPRLPGLRDRVRQHARAMRRLEITPAQLAGQPAPAATRLWRGWRAPFAGLLWVVGMLWSRVPYHLTGPIVHKLTDDRDIISTLKAVIGFGLFSVWIAATAVVVGLLAGWPWGLVTVPLCILLSIWTLHLEEARLAREGQERLSTWHARRSLEMRVLADEQRLLADDLRRVQDRLPD